MSVYFAQAGPYTKVGYSANPLARMANVTRCGARPDDLAYGADVELLGWIPGDRMREMEVLVRFADRRVAGEWHVIEDSEVRELIWADPRGIDVVRMAGLTVFAALRFPEATRDELAAAGYRIEGVSTREAINGLGRKMGAVL